MYRLRTTVLDAARGRGATLGSIGGWIVLIPGFWLDGSSWDDVARPLREAGHTVYTPTLPGLESKGASREAVGLRDHVDAVVALIDSIPDPVVLVGHSGGGAIAHGAVDARPDRIARVVYVDSGPLGDGGSSLMSSMLSAARFRSRIGRCSVRKTWWISTTACAPVFESEPSRNRRESRPTSRC